MNNPEPKSTEEFIELLTREDQAITAYVMSMVPSSTDAQDILQETKMTLWRSYSDFEPGTSFGAWARRVALHRILDFRKRKARESQRIWFSSEVYELLSQQFESDPEVRAKQLEMLRSCIRKLQTNHQQILTLRYFHDASVDEVAARVSRTVEATYRVLSRIRLALKKCMAEASART